MILFPEGVCVKDNREILSGKKIGIHPDSWPGGQRKLRPGIRKNLS
jgi:hypothetical protein